MRFRAPKRLPSNYFGNGTILAFVVVTAYEVLTQSIGYLAAKLRTFINQHTEETLPDMLDSLANEPFGCLLLNLFYIDSVPPIYLTD
jgi:hypothetical protein